MEETLKLTWSAIKIVIIFKSIFLMIPNFVCFFNFLVFGIKETPLPFSLIYTNPKSVEGYLINFCFDAWLTVLASAGYSSSECANIFVTIQTKAYVDTLKFKIEELEAELLNPVRNLAKISQMMKIVIERHRLILNYHKLIVQRL